VTDLERLARALLLFHRAERWTGQMRIEWAMLTDTEEATTATLCNLARRLLQEEGAMTWMLANAVYGSPGYMHYLDNGWEPFAIIGSGADTLVWFRKVGG